MKAAPLPERLVRLALGDFLDRARRPAYVAVLAAAVALGYLAVPETGSHWVVMRVGDYRGRYDSAYTSTVVALAAALWLPLGGFYVVRDALGRDHRSGVGELLAATPLRTAGHLVAKFLAGALVLASMVGVLAVTAVVMQLARGESTAVDPVAVLLPFLVVTLPVVVLTAAAALLTETVPLLRGGAGNVAWFFVWLIGGVGGMGAAAPLGGLGVHEPVASMRDALLAQGGRAPAQDFSLGFTYEHTPLRVFDWDGFTPSAGYLLGRAGLLLLAVALAVLPAGWYPRFAPAADGGRVRPRAQDPAGTPHGVAVRPAGFHGVPRTPVRTGRTGRRLPAGELRILLRGNSVWWWAGIAAITVAGALAPLPAVSRIVLPAAWLWPALLWSRLGAQRHTNGVTALLGAYPGPHRRALAEWLAGVAVAALAGAVPLIRMLFAADLPGVTAWCGGALFVPALALALGTLSRTGRLFQAVYLPLWYTTANGLPLLDFMGANRTEGHLAGPGPLLFLALAALLLGAALLTGTARRARA
ncbi:hypothetical protein [Streptomyces sp. 891-h]|uniref:hypothetical protein n=1 Tax=unclassified Streptomyces TaxID=2593676 RepID=UPI001FA9FA25|nr:hypothetical protein [Streptomyces sp. 891-h]UNZ16671.1 hypothetical protein HC362_05865 [Streptomyces sp. 891-h]